MEGKQSTESILTELSDLVNRHSLSLENETFYVTDIELCDLFHISRTTTYRMRKQGIVPYILEGNNIKYAYDAILLALKTAKLRIPRLTKVEAVERLVTYRKLLNM